MSPSQTVEITITVQDVSEVSFDSAGSVELSGLNGDTLVVTLRGAGHEPGCVAWLFFITNRRRETTLLYN
ncbi:MAG: hypothetical protein WD740_08895 [Anaerolineales bacterium]